MGGIVGRLFANRRRAVHGHSRLARRFAHDDADDVFASARHRRPKSTESFIARAKYFREAARAYERSLIIVLRHPAITLMILVLTIILNIFLFVLVPKGFFSRSRITARFPVGFKVPRHFVSRDAAATLRFVTAITNDPAVQNVIWLHRAVAARPIADLFSWRSAARRT